MKDFLVKLSRNSKIMIPAVAVLALGIYSGSYIIRHRDTVAKQEEQAKQQEDEARKAAENFETIETEQKQSDNQSAENNSDDKNETEQETETDKQKQDVKKVSMTVSASVSGNTITVTANYESAAPGTCTVQLLQDGNLLATATGDASGGQCIVKLDRPAVSGEVKVQVMYAASDLSAKALEDRDIKL